MKNKKVWYSQMFKLFFWLTLCLVAVLSMLAVPGQQIFHGQDKLSHLVVYMVLFWLLLLAYGKQWSLISLGILLACFSALIEVAQSFTGYRQAEWLDLLANILGILVAVLFYKALQSCKNTST
jgi:VanZ family protein